MPLLPLFDTPASLRDVPAGSPFYANWSSFISSEIADLTPGDNNGAFYDPTVTNVSVAGEKAMVWMGFPRDVILPNRRDDRAAAFALADGDVAMRSRQNEYFEWRVDNNPAGRKITKVTFVTEFRQYFQKLWDVDRAAVVSIYRNLVSPAVQEADLRTAADQYDFFNRWNTTDGIVHYIQGINTLGAAVGLCQSSVTAPPPNQNNYEAQVQFAGAETSVDPRISYDVHMLVRKGLYVTLRDPIGFYIADWDNSGITKPNGRPAPRSWWKIRRGKPGMVLRLEYEVPPGQGFVVGDLKIGGRRIEFGGQLAEQIAVVIHGTAGKVGRG